MGMEVAFYELKGAGLIGENFEVENIKALFPDKFSPANFYSPGIARALIILNQVGLLESEHAKSNRLAIKHYQGKELVNGLRRLRDKGLLSSSTEEGRQIAQSYVDLLIKSRNALEIAEDLILLHERGLLEKERGQIEALLSDAPEPNYVTGMIIELNRQPSTKLSMDYAYKKSAHFFSQNVEYHDQNSSEEKIQRAMNS